ncbi:MULTISPECIES: hypothetical protein [unclassified Schlesneria]|uniref:hypothetical protein n=1 Tax=Schlesneria TaxID=656899 RepID=UPI0035A05CEC
MMETDLVIESESPATLTKIRRAVSKHLTVYSVYADKAPENRGRRRLIRIQLRLSEIENTRENLAASLNQLVTHSADLKPYLCETADITGFVLIAASVGSHDVYARTIAIGGDFLDIVRALNCSVVVSSFPVGI